ncbi:MAG: hypothetical protein EPN84_06995 [Legionella sp.]|nr:MAG: hypothetical protein EPN84_06995 [Legionella sp.]
MAIRVHDDESPLKGAQVFANQALNYFLMSNKNNKEPKYDALRTMMQTSMWITDLRLPEDPQSNKRAERFVQYDLVGFQNDKPVCFTVLCDSKFKVEGFKQTELEKMSEATQEMVQDILDKPGVSKGVGG